MCSVHAPCRLPRGQGGLCLEQVPLKLNGVKRRPVLRVSGDATPPRCRSTEDAWAWEGQKGSKGSGVSAKGLGWEKGACTRAGRGRGGRGGKEGAWGRKRMERGKRCMSDGVSKQGTAGERRECAQEPSNLLPHIASPLSGRAIWQAGRYNTISAGGQRLTGKDRVAQCTLLDRFHFLSESIQV